jgi:hypothetical protein
MWDYFVELLRKGDVVFVGYSETGKALYRYVA